MAAPAALESILQRSLVVLTHLPTPGGMTHPPGGLREHGECRRATGRCDGYGLRLDLAGVAAKAAEARLHVLS